jgi:hypothetical protein
MSSREGRKEDLSDGKVKVSQRQNLPAKHVKESTLHKLHGSLP